MPLTFPTSPAVNDVFTSNGRSWKWNGTSWDLVPIAHTHALADLVDFNVTTPATDNVLSFNGTKWANVATIPQTAVSGLVSSLAGKAASSHTHDASNISTTVQVAPGSYWVGEASPTNGRVVLMSSSGSVGFYVQTYLANAGDRMDVIQTGTGTVTFIASGVTLRMPTGKTKLTGQWSAATVICITAGTEYVVVGDLS